MLMSTLGWLLMCCVTHMVTSVYIDDRCIKFQPHMFTRDSDGDN